MAPEATLPPGLRLGLPFGVFVIALLFLGAGLQDPPTVVFDEAHYVRASREIARGELMGTCGDLADVPINCEHPPLGKLLMAGSLRLFRAGHLDLSYDAYERGCGAAPEGCPAGRSWDGCNAPRDACASDLRALRLPSALAGASAIAAAYLLALRWFHSTAAGLAAAFLLLADTLWYLQSRMAMLDVFAGAFGLWAVALAAGRGPASRLGSTVLMGAALSSKYNAAFLLPLFFLLHLARTGPGPAPRRAAIAFLYSVALPTGLFVATHVPFLLDWATRHDWGYGVGQFVLAQAFALGWDFGADFDHTSASPPWAWIPHLSPTFYYWPTHPDYQPPLIYAVGNVALWWPATVAALAVPVVLGARWIRTSARSFLNWDRLRALPRQRFHMTPTRGLFLAVLYVWVSYAPWFLLARTQFNFYATFLVPSLAVLLGGVLVRAAAHGPRARTLAVAALALVGAWSALWWPLVSGADVPRDYYDAVWNLVPWMAR